MATGVTSISQLSLSPDVHLGSYNEGFVDKALIPVQQILAGTTINGLPFGEFYFLRNQNDDHTMYFICGWKSVMQHLVEFPKLDANRMIKELFEPYLKPLWLLHIPRPIFNLPLEMFADEAYEIRISIELFSCRGDKKAQESRKQAILSSDGPMKPRATKNTLEIHTCADWRMERGRLPLLVVICPWPNSDVFDECHDYLRCHGYGNDGYQCHLGKFLEEDDM